MANFDYFKNYVDHIERYNKLEAHEQHILEFKAMCAQMITDSIPHIKQECLDAMREEQKKEEQQEKVKPKRQQQIDVEVQVDADSIRKKVIDAI